MSGCICKLVIHLKALLVKPLGVFFSNPFTIDLLRTVRADKNVL